MYNIEEGFPQAKKEQKYSPWGKHIYAVPKEQLLSNVLCIIDHFKDFGFYYEWDGNRVEDFEQWLAWSDLYFNNIF